MLSVNITYLKNKHVLDFDTQKILDDIKRRNIFSQVSVNGELITNNEVLRFNSKVTWTVGSSLRN